MSKQKQPILTEDVRVALGLLLAITSLVVGVLAVGFTIVSEVGGLIALCAAVIAFFRRARMDGRLQGARRVPLPRLISELSRSSVDLKSIRWLGRGQR